MRKQATSNKARILLEVVFLFGPILILCNPAIVLSQEVESTWQFKRVIVTKESSKITKKGAEPEIAEFGDVFRVRKDDGQRVLVSAKTFAGWIEKSDVLPLAEAYEFFSAELNDNSTKHEFRIGKAACDQFNDANAALQEVNFVLKQDKENVRALFLRAMILKRMKTYRSAVKDIDLALKLAPNDIKLKLAKADLLCLSGEYYAGKRLFRDLLKEEPTYAAAISKMAYHEMMGPTFDVNLKRLPPGPQHKTIQHLRKLREAFEAARKIDPTSPTYHNNVAWTEFLEAPQSRDSDLLYDSALANAHRAIECDPTYYRAHNTISWLESSRSDLSGLNHAWLHATHSLVAQPRYLKPLRRLAKLQKNHTEFQEVPDESFQNGNLDDSNHLTPHSPTCLYFLQKSREWDHNGGGTT